MINTSNAKYQGFAATPNGREYHFLVRPTSAETDQECTLEISNAAFASRRLGYQDGPHLCALTLHRESASPEGLKRHYLLCEADLNAYSEARAAGARRPRLRHFAPAAPVPAIKSESGAAAVQTEPGWQA